MGLGLLGRGVGDAAYIAESGATEVIVTDLKDAAALATSVKVLERYPDVKLVLGEHRREDFQNRDLILVAAGVPLNSEYLEVARRMDVPLYQSAALFASISQTPVVGITGTRGKSTVTAMISHVIEMVTSEEVIRGGNIRGISNLQLLKEVHEDSLAVMELDSWQLQGWGWAKMSPQVAVFTNFMSDHLDYYQKGGFSEAKALERYFLDKANIFRYQDEFSTLVTTTAVFDLIKQYCPELTLGQEVVLVDDSLLPVELELVMPGVHNRFNAALATAALEALGLTREEIFPALASFSGVEGRLQQVTTRQGVKIFNDNNATTPTATIMALKALASKDKDQGLILIAGGASKGLSAAELAYEIGQTCRQVFLIPGSGTEELLGYLHDNQIPVAVLADLRTAYQAALQIAVIGDTILFSPGFASFSQYKNEYERNDEFLQLVRDSLDVE